MNQDIEKLIVQDKKNGLSDKDIGGKYGVTLKAIERIVTREFGVNISNAANHLLPSTKKTVKTITPKGFTPEETTVWSFKSRGSWATHNGNYRGNWSPYIPRNVILRYSKEHDLVVDYFCGAGTTGVECKLLNRNFIGIDINSVAIELATENIDFKVSETAADTKTTLRVGDARDLNYINDATVDLVCAHPPYADIIRYTHDNEGDLSVYGVAKFLDEIGKVARESYRILRQNGHCAILIGDMRKNKNVVPLGFRTIERYLAAGFVLKDLVIKRQHNCKTTGFWYSNSVKYNFLLLAHEYLAIFEKRKKGVRGGKEVAVSAPVSFNTYQGWQLTGEINTLESTTVWIFNEKDWQRDVTLNLTNRYSSGGYVFFGKDAQDKPKTDLTDTDLIIAPSGDNMDELVSFAKKALSTGGILAIVCEDVRRGDGLIVPTALKIEQRLRGNSALEIKELIVVSIENGRRSTYHGSLDITHKYILIYRNCV
ncbi:RNA methylase [Candidatus Magnetobacterium bavaricum]|uniref:Methyltransferase n=1 Tax=Candidatus Magnetobacterium bavaricum TaxID=29290 RepID=A0A0F3GI83_9BACT|nr:RNA methylase [Candidatus Magnetobacterium bavaricum]